MKIDLRYQLEVRDGQGRVLNRRTAKSRSYLKAFVDILWAMFGYQTNSFTTLDTGGTPWTLAHSGQSNSIFNLGIPGPDNDATLGLVVGTGTDAVLITDNKLQTKILHGLTPNTMDYEAQVMVAIETTGSTRRFTTRRVFINSSGAVITINECGSYAYAVNSANAAKIFAIIRDIVAGGLAVPNGGSATLVYTIGVTA